MSLLEIRGLRGGHPGTTVLNGIDIDVSRGSVLSLLGRNGVGKSTLMTSIMGMLDVTGSIRFDGHELVGLSTDRIARAGLALVPQGRRVFGMLTVEENLRIAARRPGDWTIPDVYDLFPRLVERRTNRGDQLSGGEQEMLAIGRALLTNPRLLLMDEPSDGLAPTVVDLIGDTIAALAAAGVTILLVEQNLPLALRVADQVAVMVKGRIALTGEPEGFLDDDEQVRELLGIGSSNRLRRVKGTSTGHMGDRAH
ncbi:ABC transporter ATP-binding protein [Streptomyces asiaticus]|uniref:ABC transporter ATP-binding protein n=1 Tax=Streptomyces TaxID=1883 RepID=UPI00368247DC